MKIRFTKGGVFTSEGKVAKGDELDLPADEANMYMDREHAVPAGRVEEVASTEEKVEEEVKDSDDDSAS